MGLSVVVACHDVAEFLPACLDSLLAQELPATEVILVDDGSTDGTGEICERYAAQNPGWQVVKGPGSGPGGARNLGLEHVTQEYLAFVDGDDRVPAQAYRVLVETLDRTGSDFACGDALRYDGSRLSPSGPHRNAILATKLRTTIERTPSLMYDTTSWNKVFRTSFWRDADLRFLPDVTYEDLEVMTAAHVAATSVDVLKTPVYWWRRRIDAGASITQRRAEVDNLLDRMNAIDAVARLVAQNPALKRAHDRKILTFDIPLYLPKYSDASPQYQELFRQRVGAFIRDVDPQVLAELPPRDRVRYWLIEQDLGPELLEFLEFERDPYALRKSIAGDGVTYADLPFFRQPGFPDELFVWGQAQPVASQVETLRWTEAGLAVSGYAYLEGIDSGGPDQRKLRVRVLGGEQPYRPQVKWHTRPDLTADENHYDVTYDNAGLSFTIECDALPAAGTLRVEVDVTAPGGRRRVPFSGCYDGAAHLPQRVELPDGRIAAVRWRSDALAVAVYPPEPRVAQVRISQERALQVDFAGVADGYTVLVRRRDDFAQLSAPLAGTVEFDLAAMPELATEVTDLDVMLQSGDEEPRPAIMLPGVSEVLQTRGGREFYARAGVTGGCLVTVRTPRPRLTAYRRTRSGLVLAGDRPAGLESLVLENRNGLRTHYPVRVTADSWEVVLPAEDRDTEDGITHLVAGRWSLLTQDDIPIHVAQGLRESMTEVQWQTIDKVKFGLRARRSATAVLAVDPAGDIRPPGLHGRQEIITEYYPKRRTKRLRKTILFENWKGKQYSDSLRAIDEELRRRRDRRRRVWVVRDEGVRMPKGVHTVLRFSPEYYDLLARSRWVVANDSIDPSYVKRDDGQIYLQTWHGTPLKKVGQDIEKVNFARKGYLESFANESAKWDYLVSPNAYSSEILGRAFGVAPQQMLNTGYPRNDIFYRPERVARAAATRQRLGLAPDKKVILYAPTWRDDRYDERGRYLFELKLNVDAMRERFGDTHALLLRGHHLLATRAGTATDDDFLINVSSYPDIADLYLIADVLITDYSSTMFDFPNTGKPILFYAWDLDDYRDRVRGMYFDLTDNPPGPICRTSLEVFDAVSNLPDVQQQYAGAYDEFRQRFCAWEDGFAAARVIDAALR